jgi:hypothetical protein
MVDGAPASVRPATGDVPPGLHDRGILEFAVMRPRCTADYQHADVFEQAAALARAGVYRAW